MVPMSQHVPRLNAMRSEAKDDGKVGFGNTVTLLCGKKEFEFVLVSKHESDPAKKKLSSDSPFGIAVVGKSVGDKVSVKAPAGVVEYVIVKIG